MQDRAMVQTNAESFAREGCWITIREEVGHSTPTDSVKRSSPAAVLPVTITHPSRGWVPPKLRELREY